MDFPAYSLQPHDCIRCLLMKTQGFSLIEITLVLLVVAILLSGMLMPLAEFMENAKREQTQQELENIKEALFKFLIINRRLPCPTLPEQDGFEGRGANVKDDQLYATYKCSEPNAFGFVPWKTLNFKGAYNKDDLLVDIWGNPYHYVLSNTGSANSFPECNGGGRSVFASYNKITEGFLCKQAEGKNFSDANLIVNFYGQNQSDTVAVVFSTGKDGYSLMSPLEEKNFGQNDLTTAETITSSTTNTTYILADDLTFFYADYNPYPTNPNKHFDDLMVWISTPELIGRMTKAGILP